MQNRIVIHTCILIVLISNSIHGQFAHEHVLKDRTDENLWMDVRALFRPDTTMDYNIARDTLYSKIDAVDNILECIYTGMKLPLPDGVDATEYVYLNGMANGMNAEHVYPQSYGLDVGIQRSDMHNLFPCRIATNSDRGNRPFGESPDNTTDKWYWLTEELETKPTSNIDSYSELGKNGKFEPRENKKGDIARALFYIYTIYRDEVVAVDPDFLPKQFSDICNWHFADPVDEVEWKRNILISNYQSGKRNPFVLDCSLAARTYCDIISDACEELTTTPTIDVTQASSWSSLVIPNPVTKSETFLVIDSDMAQSFVVQIFDINGKKISSIHHNVTKEGRNIVPLALPELSNIFFVQTISVKDATSRMVKVIAY